MCVFVIVFVICLYVFVIVLVTVCVYIWEMCALVPLYPGFVIQTCVCVCVGLRSENRCNFPCSKTLQAATWEQGRYYRLNSALLWSVPLLDYRDYTNYPARHDLWPQPVPLCLCVCVCVSGCVCDHLSIHTEPWSTRIASDFPSGLREWLPQA